MHHAERAIALGADFRLLGTRRTLLKSTKPVVSICAVRTGCGKSPTSRHVAAKLGQAGHRVAVVRHPMPYGDLARQAVQRFASLEDLTEANCTIEEREEYEPHIEAGHLVFAGVDYAAILRAAEQEADVILWDGGNNDLPFFEADIEVVLVDPHRSGHEETHFPGEANLYRAHVVVLTKLDTAEPTEVGRLRDNVERLNPAATIVESEMPITVTAPAAINGARVLVVEDGPTLTHGGMRYGAGTLAAHRHGAAEIVDPRPHAVGSLRETLERYRHLDPLLPAMGYGEAQIDELSRTIQQTPCDRVLIATPVDLSRLLKLRVPTTRVRYAYADRGEPYLAEIVKAAVERRLQNSSN